MSIAIRTPVAQSPPGYAVSCRYLDRFDEDILHGNGFTSFPQAFEIERNCFAYIPYGFVQRISLAMASFQHRRKGVVASIFFMLEDDGTGASPASDLLPFMLRICQTTLYTMFS